MKKHGGLIRNWQIHNLSVSQEAIDQLYPGANAKPMVFTGTVVSGSDRWFPGYHMRSSLIVNIDRDKGVIETRNTIYDIVDEGNDIFPDLGDAVNNIFY